MTLTRLTPQYCKRPSITWRNPGEVSPTGEDPAVGRLFATPEHEGSGTHLRDLILFLPSINWKSHPCNEANGGPCASREGIGRDRPAGSSRRNARSVECVVELPCLRPGRYHITVWDTLLRRVRNEFAVESRDVGLCVELPAEVTDVSGRTADDAVH